ncbi:hypothetical protein V6N11_005039 [Hibiscus sabdariffa]|uniref:Uncharacterized protein n=2 Tax=Hibiscus sabdariffa TaxID=183260 RepID=A0ABR2N6A5_9ROSI
MSLQKLEKNIAEQLKEYHKDKAVRQRRKEELEERIRLGDHGDYSDNDTEVDELTIAKHESIRSKMNGRKDNTKEQEHVKIQFMNLEEVVILQVNYPDHLMFVILDEVRGNTSGLTLTLLELV